MASTKDVIYKQHTQHSVDPVYTGTVWESQDSVILKTLTHIIAANDELRATVQQCDSSSTV